MKAYFYLFSAALAFFYSQPLIYADSYAASQKTFECSLSSVTDTSMAAALGVSLGQSFRIKTPAPPSATKTAPVSRPANDVSDGTFIEAFGRSYGSQSNVWVRTDLSLKYRDALYTATELSPQDSHTVDRMVLVSHSLTEENPFEASIRIWDRRISPHSGLDLNHPSSKPSAEENGIPELGKLKCVDRSRPLSNNTNSDTEKPSSLLEAPKKDIESQLRRLGYHEPKILWEDENFLAPQKDNPQRVRITLLHQSKNTDDENKIRDRAAELKSKLHECLGKDISMHITSFQSPPALSLNPSAQALMREATDPAKNAQNAYIVTLSDKLPSARNQDLIIYLAEAITKSKAWEKANKSPVYPRGRSPIVWSPLPTDNQSNPYLDSLLSLLIPEGPEAEASRSACRKLIQKDPPPALTPTPETPPEENTH